MSCLVHRNSLQTQISDIFFFAATAMKRSPGFQSWRSELCWIFSCSTLSSLCIGHRQSATAPLAHQGCILGLSIFLEAGGYATSTPPSFPFKAAHRLGRIQFLSLAVFRCTPYFGRLAAVLFSECGPGPRLLFFLEKVHGSQLGVFYQHGRFSC